MASATNQFAGKSKAADQLRQSRYRFLRRVQLVAAVRHIHHIGDWVLRQRRPALREQECLFMVIAEKATLRAIGLAEDDVPDRLKTRALPCCEELVYLRPAVEAEHQAVLPENSIGLRHRGLQPVAVHVVLNSAAIAISVVHQIRWVSQNEIEAVGSHLLHRLDAVGVEDLVAADLVCLDCEGHRCISFGLGL